MKKLSYIDKFYEKISMPSLVVSIIIGLIVYMAYYFLFKAFPDLKLSDYNLVFIATGLCIAIEFYGTNYFLTNVSGFFCLNTADSANGNSKNEVCNTFLKNFNNRKIYVLLIFFVLAPFILLTIYYLELGYPMFFSLVYGIKQALLFDIYNNAITILLIYLIAMSVWIMINISSMLKFIISKDNLCQTGSSINESYLSPICNLNLNFIIYYSIITVLALLTYYTPKHLIYYESFIFIFFYLLVLSMFLENWYLTRKVLNLRIKHQMDKISSLIDTKRIKLLDRISKESKADLNEINLDSTELELLYKEKDRLQQIDVGIYGLKSKASFIVSIVATFVTFLNNIHTLQSDTLIRTFYNMSLNIHIWHLISMIYTSNAIIH